MSKKEKKMFKRCVITKLIVNAIQYKKDNITDKSIEELVINRIVYMAYNHILLGLDEEDKHIKIFPNDILNGNVIFISNKQFSEVRKAISDLTVFEWSELFSKYFNIANNTSVVKRRYY